ncbi:MAG: hypothetical protein ACFB0G_22720 [Leptolyngbyaceae cyanobacterium]
MLDFPSVSRPLLPLLMPVAIWGGLVLFITSGLFALDDGLKQLQRLHQVPCDRCRYHTGNAYLRCTLQPLSAFSENAIGCPDYEPQGPPDRVSVTPWISVDAHDRRLKRCFWAHPAVAIARNPSLTAPNHDR